MLLITLANVFIIQIQIRLLCDGHAGMSQESAQSVDVHAIHQTSLGEVIPQTMGRELVIQTAADQILLEIAFKIADLDVAATLPNGEQVVAIDITILVLQPPPQDGFCLLREEHRPILSALGDFCPKVDPSSGQFQIFNQEAAAFTQPHSAVQHQHNHYIISVFRVVGSIHAGQQPPQFVIREVLFCLAIHTQLANLLHGVSFDEIVPIQPVEEHTKIADVVVDGGCGNRFAEVTAAVWMVCFLLAFHSVEGVFSSLLEITNVVTDDRLCNFINSSNAQLFQAPTLEQSQRLLITLHGFRAQLGATAINHKFIDLPIKIQTNHDKTPLIFIGLKYPIDQECS